jgi:hypothetical protein
MSKYEAFMIFADQINGDEYDDFLEKYCKCECKEDCECIDFDEWLEMMWENQKPDYDLEEAL